MTSVLSLDDLRRRPDLADSMFRDRTLQFRDRLRWSVDVTPLGHEYDEYDDDDATYVIVHNCDHHHLGSLRLRHIDRPNMLVEKFGTLLVNADSISFDTLEVTRYCVSPTNATARQQLNLHKELFDAAHQVATERGCTRLVAVFDISMLRIYRRHGWAPSVLSEAALPSGRVGLGLWHTDHWSVNRSTCDLGASMNTKQDSRTFELAPWA